MKRIGRAMVAVVLAAGLAGCSSGGGNADPVGTWDMTWDWACDGTEDGGGAYHFFANGTLIDSEGDTGSWTLVEDTITINYTFGSVYDGIIDGSTLEGNYYLTDGTGGCWSATKTSDTP